MDRELLSFAIDLILPIVLLFAGWFVGTRTERSHYASIKDREKEFLRRPAMTSKQWEEGLQVRDSTMVVGSVVLSIDHFKRFLSVFRLLFGGEVHSYSSLIDRARREAILRMKEAQPDADAYINTRLETSTISGNSGRDKVGTIEVLAYGTAIVFDQPPATQPRPLSFIDAPTS